MQFLPLALQAASLGAQYLGRNKQPDQFSTVNPQQQELLQQLLSGVQGQGGSFGYLNPQTQSQNFQQYVADPTMQRFMNRTVPGIQQKYAGIGQLRGTNAGDDILRSGADIESELARLQFQAMQGSQEQGLQAALGLLNKPLFNQNLTPESDPLNDILKGFSSGLPNSLTQLLSQFTRPSGGGMSQPNQTTVG